nr:F-box/FBD/LRR-repeat protein At4g26340-like isoform X2 [Coffea arabica]
MESSDGSRFAARTRLADENASQKRTKCSEGVVNLVDRISSLPDSVLCWILSFLPTTEAVATSILSARWKILWTGVTSLHFEDTERLFNEPYKESKNDERFVKFVNKVLLLNNVQSLGKFYLCWSRDYDAFYINTWIATAIARNVRILDIIAESDTVELPNSIFTCKTLEFLQLSGDLLIKSPRFVCLPRLVTFNLIRVDDRSHESIGQILSGCAVLEFMYIEQNINLAGPGPQNPQRMAIKISSPTLKTLRLDFYADCCLDEDWFRKLEINAPALEYLYLKDRTTESFSIEGLKALCEAEIDVYMCDPPESDYCNSVVKLFLALQHVKLLTLSRDTMRFDRLTTLVVEAHWCKRSCLPALLESSVNLQVLEVLTAGWMNPDGVPRCLLTSLKEIVVQELEDRKGELAMISYFLKHGRALEVVDLYSEVHLDIQKKFQLLQKISVFPRKSDTCEVVFH